MPGRSRTPGPATRKQWRAACVFRLTGEKQYEAQFARDTEAIQPDTLLWDESAYGPFVYALKSGKGDRDPALEARIRAAILHTADESLVNTPAKRALRWGGN